MKSTARSSAQRKKLHGVKLDGKKLLFNRTEKQVSCSCDQMAALLSRISELQIRLKIAVKRNQTHFVKPLELKLQILQGVYNMFYEFTSQKAELLVGLES